MALESRIAALEALVSSVQTSYALEDELAGAAAVRRDVAARAPHGAALVRVLDDYYSLPLRSRAALLHTRLDTLCKTLVFELATAATTGETRDSPLNHVAVILQYVTRLDVDRLLRFVRARVGSSVSLRAADDVQSLCGQRTGGVSPFGWANVAARTSCLFVVTKDVALLPTTGAPFVWLGGGHPSVKLRIAVNDLLHHAAAEVADCAELRDDDGDDG